jgi:hypothetical protein
LGIEADPDDVTPVRDVADHPLPDLSTDRGTGICFLVHVFLRDPFEQASERPLSPRYRSHNERSSYQGEIDFRPFGQSHFFREGLRNSDG